MCDVLDRVEAQGSLMLFYGEGRQIMMRKDLCLKWMKAALIAGMILLTVMPAAAAEDVNLSDDASDFVLLSEAVPDAILEIRYYSWANGSTAMKNRWHF